MGKNITHKILEAHLLEGELFPGKEISIRIDQTLTQDATGTMAYLQFEALGINKVKTSLSVSYVDHNTLQSGFENADDHRYLQSVAAKYGIYFSRPGNGICHQVHLERFGIPGTTMVGSDSHTPTAGGLGMFAMGVGGIDVAVTMGGYPYYLAVPKVVKVELRGKLGPWASAKDIILELLKRLSVKGGVGKVFEYAGEGVATLSVPERATITNMGAELGATTSIFPSDDITKGFLQKQKREKLWKRMEAEADANYDEKISIDLSVLIPMAAKPHSPDNVVVIKDIAGIKVNQVCIGSCTNSSYEDLMRVAMVLKGKKVAQDVSLTISPGSKQVFTMLAKNGALADIISSGARILESACGPCIGMGQAPQSGTVSLRTFNRNFTGRSGTKDASVYLVSPEVAVASAITGVITDPRDLGKPIKVNSPSHYGIDDSMIIAPSCEPSKVEIIRGPNIKPLPTRGPVPDVLNKEVILKVGDNISTDHILPAGAKILPLRSNIPAISEYTFAAVDPDFVKRAKEKGGGIIIGGSNYGQGSSREHAAMAPMYLGVAAVIAVSFARIHRTNLINFGIVPLLLQGTDDQACFDLGDEIEIKKLRDAIANGINIEANNITKERTVVLNISLTPREKEILLAGGLLNYVKASK
ncbi:MAG: aconitate hydratase [bacterium]